MISIIIPTYNNAELLERCLSSISRQAVSEWEAIIIDDGSTDSTAVLCKKYCEKDDRFRYYYQSNSGVSAARNKGLDLCRGDYVTFLDADDYFTEDALSIIANNITKYPGKKLFIYDALIKDSEDNAYIYIYIYAGTRKITLQLAISFSIRFKRPNAAITSGSV